MNNSRSASAPLLIILGAMAAVCCSVSSFAVEEFVDRSPEFPHPNDCFELDKSEVMLAENLLRLSNDPKFYASVFEGFCKLVRGNELKAYAWWRWKQIRMGANLSESEKKFLITSPDLLVEFLYRDRRLLGYTTFYKLKNGILIPHGLFMSCHENGTPQVVGTFFHGVRNGKWEHYEQVSRKPYASGEWRIGMPWSGSIELKIAGDLTTQEFKDGKLVSGRPLDYKVQVVAIPPAEKVKD